MFLCVRVYCVIVCTCVLGCTCVFVSVAAVNSTYKLYTVHVD